METKNISTRELHRSLPSIARATARGSSFVVMNHAKPVFQIFPMIKPFATKKKKKYSLADLPSLMVSTGDKNMSKEVDKIVYGL